MVKIVGFEPTTSCMSSKRSDQLSYTFIRQAKIIISHFFPFENCLKAIFLILWIFSAIPAEERGRLSAHLHISRSFFIAPLFNPLPAV